MSYYYIGAAAHGGYQSRVDRIVLHATVSACQTGGAAGNARYLNSVGLSAHYVVDPTTTVQMLPETTVGFHDGHNVNEVGIEMCDPQSGPASRWSDTAHRMMLARVAPLVAAIAARHQVPTLRVRASLLGKRGYTGHVDVTNTWHESTHQDPDWAGPFPWGTLAALLHPAPAPKPIPAVASRSDRMFLVRRAGTQAVYAVDGGFRRWVRSAAELHAYYPNLPIDQVPTGHPSLGLPLIGGDAAAQYR